MKKIFSILLTSVLMVSCVDTVILPESKTVDEDMWQTKSDVQGVLSCAYQQLRSDALMRDFIVWGDLRSDELIVNSSSSITNSSAYKVDLTEVYSLNITPNNQFSSYLIPFRYNLQFAARLAEVREKRLTHRSGPSIHHRLFRRPVRAHTGWTEDF